jgi:hypothetical protein
MAWLTHAAVSWTTPLFAGLPAGVQQLPIAGARHPFGPCQMGFVHMTAALRLALGVEAEQDLDGLAPIRAITIRIEQAQIKRHMRMVIAREQGAGRRFVEKRHQAFHRHDPREDCVVRRKRSSLALKISPRMPHE